MPKFTVRVKRVQISYADIEIDEEGLEDALEEIDCLPLSDPDNLVDDSAWDVEDDSIGIESIDDEEEGHRWYTVDDVRAALDVSD